MNNFNRIKPLSDKIDSLLLNIKGPKPILFREYTLIVDDAINGFIDLGAEYIKDNPQEFEIFLKKLNDIIKILEFIKSKENIKETKLTHLIKEIIQEQKRDRCLRIADRKYDKPSAYKSGAVVRCRKGDIWKDLKEIGDANIKSYPYKRWNNSYTKVEYTFTTGSGLDYIVLFDLWINKADVVFYVKQHKELVKKGEIKNIFEPTTNKGELFQIMATITQIVKEFLEKTPHINVLSITPSKKDFEDKRRHNLYITYIKKHLDKSKFDIKIEKDNIYIIRKDDILENLKEDIHSILQEDESLHKWFKHSGAPGKEKGWVDCNAPIRKDGKITGYKTCGRKEGEKRAKYPSCRPTAAKCKDKGKGKTWGKTK